MADCACSNFPASLGNVTFGASVGIGTTTPAAVLDVAAAGTQEVRVGFTGAGRGFAFRRAGDFPSVQGLLTSDWSTPASIVLQGEGGSVGIGTPAPSALLDVVAPGTQEVRFGFTGAGRGFAFRRAGDYPSVQGLLTADWSTPVNIVLQGAGGNVGIGTTAPQAGLHVTPSALVEGSGVPFEVRNSGSGETRALSRFGADASGRNARLVLRVDNAQSGQAALTLYTDIDPGNPIPNLVLLPSGGALMVGTTTFDPLGPAITPRFEFFGGDAIFGGQGAGVGVSLRELPAPNDSRGAARQVLAFDAANRQVIGTYNNDGVLQAFTWNVRTGNPSTTRLYVDGGGNVGIGTTAPGAPLQIGDLTPDDVPARLRFASHHGTGGGVWDLGTGVDTSSDAARYGFAIRDQQMGATRIAVGATTGYVGIGTVTPSERLEVGGNVRASAIGLGVNPSFPLHVVGGAYLTGNVGIGTMSPSAKLHVEGGEIMSTGDPGQQAGRISAREFYGLSANGQGKKVADYSGCYYA